ncbi:hypothetical protein [Anatilimnocola aggregata]|uniref:hypothetical protein n=1 Tax=Anatilimnocola aggregata TaxID=2528021 RepID=UPI0011A98D21|nr:hypothetical protein [Anatilimnocola aggregata]
MVLVAAINAWLTVLWVIPAADGPNSRDHFRPLPSGAFFPRLFSLFSGDASIILGDNQLAAQEQLFKGSRRLQGRSESGTTIFDHFGSAMRCDHSVLW